MILRQAITQGRPKLPRRELLLPATSTGNNIVKQLNLGMGVALSSCLRTIARGFPRLYASLSSAQTGLIHQGNETPNGEIRLLATRSPFSDHPQALGIAPSGKRREKLRNHHYGAAGVRHNLPTPLFHWPVTGGASRTCFSI